MQRQLPIIEPPSELDLLRQNLQMELAHISNGRTDAQVFRDRLDQGLSGMNSADAGVVVFGSLARDEFTSGSDVDWTLLVDGQADPRHLDVAQEVRRVVQSIDGKPPGAERIFGNMTFSHEIVHRIGGEDDTNSNTTRRVLLLLEARPIGRREAFDRVLNHVLSRYVEEDLRFLHPDARFHVPRFLLNDVARYWRTMAVDFAYKRRTRGGQGILLRNLKLRMSRKLIFVSGLLACFSLHVLQPSAERHVFLKSPGAAHEFVSHLRRVLAQTPLEILASVVNRYPHLWPLGARLFRVYDEFLGALSDETKRAHLNSLVAGAETGDSLFQQLRDRSHTFSDALVELFFDEATGLADLTKTYGVF